MTTKLVIWSCSALLAAACSHAWTPSTPEVQSSGVFGKSGLTGTAQTVYWRDDDRVLFLGHRAGDYVTVGGQRILQTFLFEWNTTTNELVVRAELGMYSGLCYSQGYVRYHYRRDSGVIAKAGMLGKEEVVPSLFDGFRLNELTCRQYDPKIIERTVGGGLIPLRDEHGYWGRQYEKKASILLRRNGNRFTEHRVPIHGARPSIRWSEYGRGYVLQRLESLFSATDTSGKMWLLSPTGETKEFVIPPGPWFRGSTRYALTRKGVFLSSHAVARYDIGDAGGYLVVGDQPRRVLVGYIYSFDVSPNGCKVAASVSPRLDRGQMPDLVAVDVCALEK